MELDPETDFLNRVSVFTGIGFDTLKALLDLGYRIEWTETLEGGRLVTIRQVESNASA